MRGRVQRRQRRSRAGCEDADDVVAAVDELPARVVVALHRARHGLGRPVVGPRAVGVEQTSQEVGWVVIDDSPLPGLEADESVVLATRPVLREQAWPVLPVRLDHDGAGNSDLKDANARSHATHQVSNGRDDAGIFAVARHAGTRSSAPLRTGIRHRGSSRAAGSRRTRRRSHPHTGSSHAAAVPGVGLATISTSTG